MSDAELFELCKEVYKRTEWLGTLQVIWNYQVTVVDAGVEKWAQEEKYANYAPLYTSDYLLEKLPRYLRLQRDDMECPQKFAFKLRASTKDTNNWRAGYYNTPKKRVFENLSIDIHADTPLKALLKLTIALHEAGELK